MNELPSRFACDAPHDGCALCNDEGLPAQVLAIEETTNLARVALQNGEREIALDLLDGVQVGDFVLVHLDMAIAKIDAADVVKT